MDYSVLAELYENLENTSGRLKKVELIADVLKKTDSDILPIVTRLVRGKVFPEQSESEIGIASQLMIKIISEHLVSIKRFYITVISCTAVT